LDILFVGIEPFLWLVLYRYVEIACFVNVEAIDNTVERDWLELNPFVVLLYLGNP
jgi:hypothetical protein